MRRFNRAHKGGRMKASCVAILIGLLTLQSAFAHVPYLEEIDTSPETPFEIPQPLDKSRAFYSWFETGDDVDVFVFQVTGAIRVFAQAIVPVCHGYEELLPWFAVVGPGLPVPDIPLPFELPAGYGAWVVQNRSPGHPDRPFSSPLATSGTLTRRSLTRWFQRRAPGISTTGALMTSEEITSPSSGRKKSGILPTFCGPSSTRP